MTVKFFLTNPADNFNELKTFHDIKKYIKNLLEKKYSDDKKDFLKELKACPEDVISTKGFLLAIEMFHQWVLFEKKLQQLKTRIESHSILQNEYKNPGSSVFLKVQEIETKISDFQARLKSHTLALGAYTRSKAEHIHGAFREFEVIANSFNFKSPDSYTALVEQAKSFGQSKALYQTIELFNDYVGKNKFYYFHNRKQENEASTIVRSLRLITQGNQPESEKLAASIQCILEQKNKILAQRKLTVYQQHQSSFFRRAHFALNLLDAERRSFKAPQSVISLKPE